MSSYRVVPTEHPVSTQVRPPGSKSETIRALTVAGLAEGRSHLYGALDAEDSQAMIRVLRGLGVGVSTRSEPWSIDGTGGYLIASEDPLDAGESGLTARIALVLAALAEGVSVVDGRGRLRERPFGGVVETLSDQGVDIVTTNGGLPMTITGQGGLWGGAMSVDCTHSSQFASALMLGAPLTTKETSLRIEGLEGSKGYLAITARVMEAFGAEVSPTITGFDIGSGGYTASDYVIEPDASAAVYPMVAAAITGGRAVLEGLTSRSPQPDVGVARQLQRMGCTVEDTESGLVVDASADGLRSVEADMAAAPDGALALAVACLYADGTSRLEGLHSLRFKESDRLEALTGEMKRLGGQVTMDGDALLIRGGDLHAGRVNPHGDHRIAMSMALVGLTVDGVEMDHPEVVNKTWPGYWAWVEGLTDGTSEPE